MISEEKKFRLIDAWIEWKETCAIDLCGKEAQGALSSVASGNFKRLLGTRYADLRPSDASNAFRLLEGHLYANDKINGRPFKEYLFDVVANRPDGAEKNLTGYLFGSRGVMRSMINQAVIDEERPEVDEEGNLRPETEDQVTRATEKNMTVEPPQKSMGRNEYDELASELFETLPCRVRLAFFCFLKRIPLYHPEVLKLAGVGKSVFSELPTKEGARLVGVIHEHGFEENETPEIFTYLLAKIDSWGKEDLGCQTLLQSYSLPDNESLRRRKTKKL